jgi:hypothetical protein
MRPLYLCNGAFDSYVIYFSIIVSALSFGVELDIGTSDNYKDCAISWECFILLLGFLGLWQRLWWWISFIFDLGVIVLHLVGDLRNCWGYVICGVGGGYVICGAGRRCGWLVVA